MTAALTPSILSRLRNAACLLLMRKPSCDNAAALKEGGPGLAAGRHTARWYCNKGEDLLNAAPAVALKRSRHVSHVQELG